jgi:hypothetical protein
MAAKNANSKRSRKPAANNAVTGVTAHARIEHIPYDHDVRNAAVTTLVRALLSGLRHSLSFVNVSVLALRRQNFDLGIDLAAALKKSLEDNLHVDIPELERLLTYVHKKDPPPRAR